MDIAVVIPAYNNAEYISRALDSVLNQTSPPAEIIVVDDGSTDNTKQIVTEKYPGLRYITQPNAGASAARNTGIKAANSPWIAFLDADDQWLENKLRDQSRLLSAHPGTIWATGNFLYAGPDTQIQTPAADPEKISKCLANKEIVDFYKLFRCGLMGWTGTMLIKKSALIEAGLFTPGLKRFNDIDMWFRIACLYPRIGYLHEPLGIYHSDHGQSITKRYQQPDYLIDAINRNLNFARRHGKLELFIPCAKGMLRSRIHRCLVSREPVYARDLIKGPGKMLPFGYRTIVRILTLCPPLTAAMTPLLRKLNKLLKIRI